MRRYLNFALLLLLAGCGGDSLLDRVASTEVTSGDLRIHTIFALPPFTDAPLAVYFTVENQALVADTLLAASTTAAESVVFHGGEMARIDAVPVPGRGTLAMRPGALHLMLEPPLDRDYVRGDSVAVTLSFARGAVVTLRVPVIDYAEVDAVLTSRSAGSP